MRPSLLPLAATQFRQALGNLRVGKMRSFLTILGMVFGTGAVVAIRNTTDGAAEYLRKEVERLGTRLVTVQTEDGASGTLSRTDRDYIVKYMPELESASIVHRAPAALARYGVKLKEAELTGVDADYMRAASLVPERGRAFDSEDVRRSALLVVLGSQVKQALFGENDPVGQAIHVFIDGLPFSFQVTGYLRERGGSASSSIDSAIFAPFTAVEKVVAASARKTSFVVAAPDEGAVDDTKAQLRALLAPRFPAGLRVSDAREAIERAQQSLRKQEVAGLALALISLVTGGIGIMNVMLLSVTQRRREIGLRKAVGASDRDILFQFLAEAVLICLIGGVLGIILGSLIGLQISKVLGDWTPVLSLSAIVLTLFYSCLVGIAFGLFPALRASKLDPYDALRGH